MSDADWDDGKVRKNCRETAMGLDFQVQENVETGNQPARDSGDPSDLAQPRPPTASEDGILTRRDEVVHVGTRGPQVLCEPVAENCDPSIGLRLPEGADKGNGTQSVGVTPLHTYEESPAFQVRNT
jgi:hypothetical protein